MGDKSAVLVDAQFTAANAAALADMIAATGRTIVSVIITHFHPEHILGLPILLEHFPDAKALAQKDVQAMIAQILPPMHGGITGNAPAGAFAPDFAVPDVLDGDHIMLEGERVEVLTPMMGDTALITPVYVPAIDALVASDIACIDTHLWMEEAAAPGGVDAWRESIETLQALGTATVIPGHSKPTSANDATVFDAMLAYLDHWDAALAASFNAEELEAKLLEGQEGLGFADAVKRSAAAGFPPSE